MSYDDWKQETPDYYDEEDFFECPECGADVSSEYEYCSNACQKASEL